ncbi:MAG: hypothetical protein LC799_25735 [Actinobacteria bacterium]|nr:hypothetical protein [Actinomycetota bacterium]
MIRSSIPERPASSAKKILEHEWAADGVRPATSRKPIALRDYRCCPPMSSASSLQVARRRFFLRTPRSSFVAETR